MDKDIDHISRTVFQSASGCVSLGPQLLQLLVEGVQLGQRVLVLKHNRTLPLFQDGKTTSVTE